ncbi:beta-1,3-galactosyl-O-glycosyl-glycoprotein beta-1,6-N-acetylglucosaminyltransferase 4-like [Strongylocentrotus purpuratus]|uniref:Beta-1,3-galactosyl-O-glycosyl-glycoprotein beta-1,6-N-acetylglucosaminyltransferase n=1 Tax=Strongylocentrotus purpuratus TaxID=7668 RepID=A0A7M7P4W7_STRPU|nr:beta-1,3-galactosyl-O-glycosyl-glycoprotein beta-1,6-N-acetylglucosaminyltransferase 4-like [Strongylocentrotus purpuratus]XP_030846166.1 beta-1,3-galactosyl-O-glycosyl-glycoprotein beta-1,6-N-acetylglucosaminyltransferase 4-like [Strongylocentrotus purpuratus]XP_030846167.1 beta-1,3-galactosyl-O-glycosyl-glycoprotein beta-1,6-N-acetylglucosaminyltransferase 4-like [Strongylocentrotus purpuratus]
MKHQNNIKKMDKRCLFRRSPRGVMIWGAWLTVTFVLTSSYFMADKTSKLHRYTLEKIPLRKQSEEAVTRASPQYPLTDPHGPPSAGTQGTKVESRPEFYNRYWPVNCSAVFEEDVQEIARVDAMLKKERQKSKKGEIDIASDTLVANFTQNCENYRTIRGFPTKVLSKEEEEFPLAFIILTHKNAAQVELLFRAIYQPHNVYAFHPDGNSPPEFQRAIRNMASCFDNVFVCSKLEKVQYAGFTRLLADINCMHDLVNHSVQWKYVINQCGEAFPLKTNLEMVKMIKAYHGRVDAESYDAPHKLSRFHKLSSRYTSFTKTEDRLNRYPPPGNITLHSGNAYNTLSREFVDYVLTDKEAVQFLSWINMTHSPDEHFWASLRRYHNAPGSYPNITHKDINTSFVKWGGEKASKECVGKYVRGICVISTGYLPYVSRVPNLFVNKIHYSYDPVTLQCMQELLTNRTRNPQLTLQYYKEFPPKRAWYWY